MVDYEHFTFADEQRHDYMKYRIHRILLVCSSYDGYTLEEDGHIDSQINSEYNELNMSNPPAIVRVSSAAEALEKLESGEEYDFVLTMYNVGGMTVFDFARTIKQMKPEKILLTNKENYGKIYFVNGGIGEVVNTVDCGSIMRGFDSHIPPHFNMLMGT